MVASSGRGLSSIHCCARARNHSEKKVESRYQEPEAKYLLTYPEQEANEMGRDMCTTNLTTNSPYVYM